MKDCKRKDIIRVNVDYTRLMGEIRAALLMRDLSLDEQVQILRSENSVSDDGYKPIVDYYYNHDRVVRLLTPGPGPGESELEELNRLKQDYEAKRPFLELITVMDMLQEMETNDQTAPFNVPAERKPSSKLAELRQAVGLTQREAAEQLSVDLRTYQRYEWGEIALDDIAGRRLMQLAKLFGVTVDFLLDDAGNE